MSLPPSCNSIHQKPWEKKWMQLVCVAKDKTRDCWSFGVHCSMLLGAESLLWLVLRCGLLWLGWARSTSPCLWTTLCHPNLNTGVAITLSPSILILHRWSGVTEDAATIDLCLLSINCCGFQWLCRGYSKIWFPGLPLTVKWVLANYYLSCRLLMDEMRGFRQIWNSIRTNFMQIHSTGNYSVFSRILPSWCRSETLRGLLYGQGSCGQWDASLLTLQLPHLALSLSLLIGGFRPPSSPRTSPTHTQSTLHPSALSH